MLFVETAKREIAKQRGEAGYEPVPNTMAKSTEGTAEDDHGETEQTGSVTTSEPPPLQKTEPNAPQVLEGDDGGSDDSLVQ